MKGEASVLSNGLLSESGSPIPAGDGHRCWVL